MLISDALFLIAQERERQISQEGYTPAHDDLYAEGQLALLAAAYALSSQEQEVLTVAGYLQALMDGYGFQVKPKDPIRDLVRAGALILAEIERRLRVEGREF